jgi:CDP-paratose 2-epimerase
MTGAIAHHRQAEPVAAGARHARAPRLGVVEWLRPGEHERAERLIEGLRRIGVSDLRTGISWADCHTPGGRAWYDWLLPRLAAELNVLPCFTYTPPSLGIEPKTSAPPRDLKAYADFLDVMLTAHGEHFDWVELWNEPNNLNDWDWRLDAEWRRFCEMIGGAAYWARERGKKTVLGGMCPTDPNWLALVAERGVLQYVDAIGLHAFPATWDHAWQGWDHLVGEVRAVLEPRGLRPELWATEVGYATWRHDEAEQLSCFVDALQAPLDRLYWYAFQDLDPETESQEGFHVDERHYHFGLVRSDGAPKLLYRMLERGGASAAREVQGLGRGGKGRRRRVVITGGAGFVGTNLADHLAAGGEEVVIYDSLCRPGVEENAAWLQDRHGGRIAFQIADVRDFYTLRAAVREASLIFHLAAQVAVTTSLENPAADFEVNARGTLNLLEALRGLAAPPPLIFTSTNKVYGCLDALDLERRGQLWAPVAAETRAHGIAEAQPLDFYSPYGCSKGAADQYVLDYARIFGLPTLVFRMSCIYGPHQHGTEDQGWVAHFMIRAMQGRPITIYGDGKQVRDLLFVDDLVGALTLAERHLHEIAGHAFNIGGGPDNTVSLLELVAQIAGLHGENPEIEFGDWRVGDQRWYVSDSTKFSHLTGWRPQVGVSEGIRRLYDWLLVHQRGAAALQAAQ